MKLPLQSSPWRDVRIFAAVGLAIGFTSLSLHAQTGAVAAANAAAKTPVYDIVLIKPNKSASGRMSININDDTFIAENISLKMLIGDAYDIKEDLIFGLPGWANSTHFDFTAKMVDPDPAALKKLTDEQRQQMMIPVLADRFKFQAHPETKVLPIYDLVLAKGGSKLKATPVDPSVSKDPDDQHGGTMRSHNTELSAQSIGVQLLADFLSRRLHRTVIDKTGLKGEYDFDLNWTPPEGSDNSPEAADAALFTALQEQLGLKLDSSKGSVKTLVVDHVEMPVED